MTTTQTKTNADELRTLAAGYRFIAANASCGTDEWKVLSVKEVRGTRFVRATSVTGYHPGHTTFKDVNGRVVKHGQGSLGYEFEITPLGAN